MSREKGENEKFCSECGALIRRNAEICPECGVRQFGHAGSWGGTAPNGKNRVAAALLALLLGWLGVHKFYLGQVGLGLLYLLFSWTFIPGLIALVEFVILITMSDEQFAHKYGRL